MGLRVKPGIEKRRVCMGLDPNRARGHGEANTSAVKSVARPSRHPSHKQGGATFQLATELRAATVTSKMYVQTSPTLFSPVVGVFQIWATGPRIAKSELRIEDPKLAHLLLEAQHPQASCS